jgi:hypothetical protein
VVRQKLPNGPPRPFTHLVSIPHELVLRVGESIGDLCSSAGVVLLAPVEAFLQICILLLKRNHTRVESNAMRTTWIELQLGING